MRGEPRARAVLVTITVLSVVGFNFHVVVPLLASDALDVGPEGLGLLSAAFGLGALVGALGAASRARRRLAGSPSARPWLRRACSSPSRRSGAFRVAAALLVVLGVSFTMLTTTANALVQLAAPSHLRGRVIALYLFAFAGLTPVGGLVAGRSPRSGARRSRSPCPG